MSDFLDVSSSVLAGLRVDESLCLGSGMCARTAPHLFRVVDGVAVPRHGELTVPADVDAAVDAMHGCPSGAIEVLDVG